MDTQAFYAFMAGICFTLVGLWWNVVKSKPRWKEDATLRELALGVYLSFLVPGLMSMSAQVGVENSLIWRLSFVIASVMGLIFTNRISAKTHNALPKSTFHSKRWGVSVLYVLILFFAVFPGFAQFLALKALTLEGLLVIGLVLIGHGLTWEFIMETPD